MATLKDVAQKACVDVSTVSRALNNTSYVPRRPKPASWLPLRSWATDPMS